MQVVGIVSAGAMGSALGATLRDGGARVLVALDGRSDRTRRLATGAGLEDVGSLASLLREAEVVLSVVPPGAAVDVAEEIAAGAGSARPIVVDLNAVAPSTVVRVAAVLAEAELELVDGSISGPPRTTGAGPASTCRGRSPTTWPRSRSRGWNAWSCRTPSVQHPR